MGLIILHFSELSKKICAESKHRGVSPSFLDTSVGVQVPGANDRLHLHILIHTVLDTHQYSSQLVGVSESTNSKE